MATMTMTGNAAGNYAQRLESARVSIEKMKTDKARAEATKESLEKQREGILDEVKALGVEPEDLDTEIENLGKTIEANLAEVEELIPAEYRV